MEATPKAQFSLRPATPDDLETVLGMEREVHVAPWGRENFLAELTKPYSHFLVLTDDETDSRIAGYIVYWLMFDECQILNLVVGAELRRLGFAKLLVRQAVKD